jgi:hypothetical protein
MAQRYIGANRGNIHLDTDTDLTYGTSTGSTDVELRIDDSKSWTRLELINFLTVLQAFLEAPTNISGTQFPPN